jgi:hypothetical protein
MGLDFKYKDLTEQIIGCIILKHMIWKLAFSSTSEPAVLNLNDC